MPSILSFECAARLRKRPATILGRAVRPRLRTRRRAAGARPLLQPRRTTDEQEVRARFAARRALLPQRAQCRVACIHRLAGRCDAARERHLRAGLRGAGRRRAAGRSSPRARRSFPPRPELQRRRVQHDGHEHHARRRTDRALAHGVRVAARTVDVHRRGGPAHRAPHASTHAPPLQRVGDRGAVRGWTRRDVSDGERAAGRVERRTGTRQPRQVRGGGRPARTEIPPARARARLGGA